MYAVAVVSTCVMVIVSALVMVVIVCHRKQRAKNSKPSEIPRNKTVTDPERIDSSGYNFINYNKLTASSVPEINQSIFEYDTINRQSQDIKTAIEQEDNICNKYESLSTNRNSLEHIYESNTILTNKYESLTNERDSDRHTYESTKPVLP